MKIATKQTAANIAKVLGLLQATLVQLAQLEQQLTPAQLSSPLSGNQWSITEQLAHLIACEEISAQAIYYALLLDHPTLPYVHPQRQWAKMMRFATLPFRELHVYFAIRRQILLQKLNILDATEWSRQVTRTSKRPQSVYLVTRTIALHEQDHLLSMTQAYK